MTDNEQFLNRSDALAKKMRLSLRELAEAVSISPGAFFGYRTGRLAVSSKAWRKLEAAEKAAGIRTEEPFGQNVRMVETPPRYGDADQAVVAMIRAEMESAALRQKKAEIATAGGLEGRMERMEAALCRLVDAVETLIHCHEKSHGTSSAARGQARKNSA